MSVKVFEIHLKSRDKKRLEPAKLSFTVAFELSFEISFDDSVLHANKIIIAYTTWFERWCSYSSTVAIGS